MKRFVRFLSAAAFLISSLVTAHGAPAGTLKWTYLTGNGIYSSPAIGADGTIYVGSRDSKLYAVNPDGSLKWSYATGDVIDSSPSVGRDGTIYVGSGDFKLYAVNPDGSLKWSYATGDKIRSSPAIGPEGTIYVGSGDYKLHAVNPNGTFKWSYPTGRGIYSSPAVAVDGTIYVGSSDAKLYAVNPDGSLKWSYSTEGGMISSSPAIGADGTIYVGSLSNELYAFNPDGTLRWYYDTGGRIGSSPAIGADGTIYVGSGEHSFYSIARNGALKNRLEREAGFGSPPAIGADGTIYAGSSDGTLYAVDPSTGYDIPFYSTGGAIWSSPAIGADGTIYVGSLDGNLYAIQGSSPGPATSPWPMFRRDLKHTANLAPVVIPPTLTVTKSGSGAVISSPSGIDCGDICSAGYTKGTIVTLTPIPEKGSIFSRWTGDCKGRGMCAFIMRSDKSVGAIFETGTCTYTISPGNGRTFSYLGGTVNIGITAKGSTYCPAPDISREGDWFILAHNFYDNNAHKTVTIVVAESGSSFSRSGSVVIGGNTFLITQKGRPCTLGLDASSSVLFSKDGGTGSFTVFATPDDCTWTAKLTGTSPWITIASGASGSGTGNVVYTVDTNGGATPRSGQIKVATFDKKTKPYKVKQSK